MIALAAEWGTVPDWSMVAVTAIAVAVAVVAVVYGSRQSKSAAESKDIAAQARDEARRAADASERSAESARQVADIEARRDHRAVYDEVELVEVTEQARERFDITDRVARVRTKGQRTFRYRARVFHTESSYSDLRVDVWKPGETLTLFLGSAGQVDSVVLVDQNDEADVLAAQRLHSGVDARRVVAIANLALPASNAGGRGRPSVWVAW